MTGFLKNIGLMCLSASLMASPVFAEINAVQENDTEAKISGFTESEKTEKNIIADILAPDKTYENLLLADSEEFNNILVYHNQGKTDSEGGYEFTADMTGRASGLYSVYVTDSGEKANLVYTDMIKNAQAISWLKGLTEIPSQTDFDTYRADLGFYNDLYDIVNKSEVMSLIYDAVLSDKLEFGDSVTDFEKRNEVIAVFNKATVISGVNTSKVNDVMAYSDYIGVEESKLADYLKLSFTDKANFRNELTKRVSNQSFKNEKEFDEAFFDEFILSAVKYSDGYNNIKDMLNDFANDLGITKTVTATIASDISGNDYKTTKELAKAINGSKTESGGGGGSSSGGGGGGSSFGGSKGESNNKVPTIEIEENITTNTEVKEYHVNIFTDLENVEWAKEAIVYLAELDIVNGDGNFKFNPMNNVTREQFTKMVIQAFAPNASEASVAFKDVSDGDWFAPYIKKAKALGIVNGKSETEFGAGENITRQDMAVIAYNAAKMYGISLNDENRTLFEDDENIASYAQSAVYALRAGGILNGKDNNAFCPKDFATRAEAAKIIYGLLEM